MLDLKRSTVTYSCQYFEKFISIFHRAKYNLIIGVKSFMAAIIQHIIYFRDFPGMCPKLLFLAMWAFYA